MIAAIYRALCACFGLPPSSAEASVLIREAYQEPENAPRPPRDTDVIYFSIEPDSAAAEPPPEYTKETASGVSYTPVIASFVAWCLLPLRRWRRNAPLYPPQSRHPPDSGTAGAPPAP